MNSEPDDQQKLVEIEVGRLVLRDHSAAAPQFVILREVGGPRSFPIVIGLTEASEIQRVVSDIKTERPMTHELLHNAVQALGARISSVDIMDMRKNTFYARILLENSTGVIVGTLDARPSDGIALARRARCPLRVVESVLELARTDRSQDSLEEPLDPGEGEEGGETEEKQD